MKLRLLTHDLSCTIDNLGKAARRHSPIAAITSHERDPSHNLLVAAIEFTIQLAIDQGDQDPAAMRALESALMSKIVDAP